MSYGQTRGIAGLCPNLISGSTDFSAISTPTLSQVEAWLSSGCAIIESRLSGQGYSVPVGTGVVYDWLAMLNELYAAAQAEKARTNVTLAPGERTRGQVFEDDFWKGLGKLLEQDLTAVGVARRGDDKMYVGGVSYDDKEEWTDDSDMLPPRFRRGMYAFPGTLRPDAFSSASPNTD